MRNSSQRITLNVARLFHTSVVGPRLRPQRSFHITSLANFPRKRSFFTSNPYFSQVDDDHRPSSEITKEDKGSSAAKRKPTRSNTAKNSLRRVAIIAQQPKRGSTTPGNSSDEPSNVVSATCVAESFKMPIVLEILSSHGFHIDPDGTGFDANEVVHARGVNGGDIFVFPSGTIVTWSLPPDVVTRQIMRAAEEAHPIKCREFEDLEFTTDTNREASVLKGDVIVLGTRKEHNEADKLDTTLAKVAFSSGLARSTKLAVLETALTSYFESTRNIPALLSQGAGIPLYRLFCCRDFRLTTSQDIVLQ